MPIFRNIICGNSLIGDSSVDPKETNWHTHFPAIFEREEAGFDCVIGNPPWERLKLQEREFFSHSAPEIANAVNAARRRTLIAELEGGNPELFTRHQTAKQTAERARDDVEYVLSTFTGLDRPEGLELGIASTTELILAAYDSFCDRPS